MSTVAGKRRVNPSSPSFFRDYVFRELMNVQLADVARGYEAHNDLMQAHQKLCKGECGRDCACACHGNAGAFALSEARKHLKRVMGKAWKE